MGRPAHFPDSIEPNVVWNEAEPTDVISALGSQQPRSMIRRRIQYRGTTDVETYLTWARLELEQAERNQSETKRHATQAIGHAKRALDCLFDAYIRRDWLDSKLRPRAMFSEKLDLLKRRPNFRVPWRLIPNIIAAPRDQAEHAFILPSVEEVGIAVEATESVVSALISHSDPLVGPAFCGTLLGGSSWSKGEVHHYFSGFSGPFAITWIGSDGISRVGSGIALDRENAEVLYCQIVDMTEVEHFELLTWWDSHELGSYSIESEESLRVRLRLAHLDVPE
jgi:hypothetical protein